MLSCTNLISCNFSSFSLKIYNPKIPSQNPIKFRASKLSSLCLVSPKFQCKGNANGIMKKGHLLLQIWRCYSSLGTDKNPQNPILENGDSLEEEEEISGGNESSSGGGGGGGGGSGGGEKRDWTTSFMIFGLWAGIMYYVFFLAPDQTPLTDLYFVKKLLHVIGDDGFKMNEVLVALWYILGLYPLMYSMLLLPSGRSSKSSVPVWPFLVLSCFAGAYGLIPYFAIWTPPPPPVEEKELRRWPLMILESKLTAGIAMAAGLVLIAYAGLSNGDVWKEFYQYFRESKFIHLSSIDFILLSAFAPFWVYNDMTARKWDKKGSWLLPLTLIPVLGPALYLLLRPSFPAVPELLSPLASEEK